MCIRGLSKDFIEKRSFRRMKGTYKCDFLARGEFFLNAFGSVPHKHWTNTTCQQNQWPHLELLWQLQDKNQEKDQHVELPYVGKGDKNGLYYSSRPFHISHEHDYNIYWKRMERPIYKKKNEAYTYQSLYGLHYNYGIINDWKKMATKSIRRDLWVRMSFSQNQDY